MTGGVYESSARVLCARRVLHTSRPDGATGTHAHRGASGLPDAHTRRKCKPGGASNCLASVQPARPLPDDATMNGKLRFLLRKLEILKIKEVLGMAHGGRRPGAGRKPKRARVLTLPSVATSEPAAEEPIEEFDASNSLTFDERQVWMQQAPLAFRNRTLTRSSALAFERYCKVVVMERNEAKSSGVGRPNHRGLLKQINAYELQFMLTPNGRPMPDANSQPGPAAGAGMAGKLGKFRS